MPPVRMNKQAAERRCDIIRHIASLGGTLSGFKLKELAPILEIPQYALRTNLTRLEEDGVLEVTRTFDRDAGRLPNAYRLLRDEKWFRAHADELERARQDAKRAARIRDQVSAHGVIAVEDARAEARRAKRVTALANLDRGREMHRRTREGLPPLPPGKGERERASKPVSKALREKLVREAIESTPVETLAAWGAS